MATNTEKRHMANRCEKTHAKIYKMIEAMENEYGPDDETVGKLSSIAGLLLDTAGDLRLKSGMSWEEMQNAPYCGK